MKTKLQYLRTIAAQNAKKAGVLVGASLASASAMADLDPAAQAAIDAQISNAGDLAAAVWPFAAAVVGGLVVLGLFKKFVNKAS